jgi:hypothetical protein
MNKSFEQRFFLLNRIQNSGVRIQYELESDWVMNIGLKPDNSWRRTRVRPAALTPASGMKLVLNFFSLI